MSRAEQISAAANATVAGWASLTAEQRQQLLAAKPIRPLLSGGAMLTVNGVDRWFPSRRDALDELAAFQS